MNSPIQHFPDARFRQVRHYGIFSTRRRSTALHSARQLLAQWKQVLIAYRSPWQSPHVERRIGSIRRECLDHVIVLNEMHLKRLLRDHIESYYHRARTHLSLDEDCPVPRPVRPPEVGEIVEFPEVGGLHHRYERRAA